MQAGPGPLGGIVMTLAELKVIGAVESYYSRSGPAARRQKGVEKRARDIPGEYVRPLRALDSRFHGTLQGETGPLVRRLEGHGRLRCWVQGAWLECSKDLHWLLDLCAETRVSGLGLARGSPTYGLERDKILSDYRRTLSVAGAKAQAGTLVGRLARLGPAFRGAAMRREGAKREQERRKEIRRAHWRAEVAGRGLLRGEFVN